MQYIGNCPNCGGKMKSVSIIHDLDDSRWSSKKTNAMQLLREAREILAHEGE